MELDLGTAEVIALLGHLDGHRASENRHQSFLTSHARHCPNYCPAGRGTVGTNQRVH